MVDIVQVPMQPESFLLYILISVTIICFAVLVTFIIILFRRDYKSTLLNIAGIKGKVKEIIRDVGRIDKDSVTYTQGLKEDIDKNKKKFDKTLEEVGQFVVSTISEDRKKLIALIERELRLESDVFNIKAGIKKMDRLAKRRHTDVSKFLDKIMSSVERNSKLESEVSNIKADVSKINKDIKKRYKDLVLFFVLQIFNELSAETKEDRIYKGLEDLRFFVRFSKRNKYWDKSLEKTSTEFIKNMEDRWKSKSPDISLLYSSFLDEIKGG